MVNLCEFLFLINMDFILYNFSFAVLLDFDPVKRGYWKMLDN